MASTTKIMTAILVLEHCGLDEIVTVSKNAARQPEVHMDLKEGEQHIRRMLQSNGFHGYSVKIFRDAKQYVNRIPAVFEEAGAAEENSQEGILSLIKAISL